MRESRTRRAKIPKCYEIEKYFVPGTMVRTSVVIRIDVYHNVINITNTQVYGKVRTITYECI